MRHSVSSRRKKRRITNFVTIASCLELGGPSSKVLWTNFSFVAIYCGVQCFCLSVPFVSVTQLESRNFWSFQSRGLRLGLSYSDFPHAFIISFLFCVIIAPRSSFRLSALLLFCSRILEDGSFECLIIMVTYFLVSAREAIDEAKELTSGENEQLFKLNKNQCKYVVQKLSECEEVLQSVELITDSPAFQRSNAALYKEIYRVVMEALALIKDCCDEQWLKAAAITHQSGIDKREYFAKAVYELEWCTFTLYHLCLREKTRIAGKESTSFLEPERCDGKLGVFDMFKLERAAQQDRENLRAHLELLTQFDHVCDASKESNDVSGSTEACLAVQLSQSLNTDDVPASTDHPATISMSRTSLWKVYVPCIPQATSLGRGGFALVHETEWLREKSVTKAFPGHRVEDENLNTAASDDFPSAALGTHDHPHDMITKVSCNEDNHKKSENCPAPLMDVMYEDLDQFLRKRSELMDDAGPLSIPISVDLMLQIAQGIKSLHDTGFAHRDLKPSNILLKPLAGVPELEYMEGYLIAKVAHFGIPETKKWTGSICSSSHQKPDVDGTLKSTNSQTSMAMIDDETNDNHDATMLPLPSQGDEEDDRFTANDVYDFAMICYELLMRGSEDSMPGGVHKRRRAKPFNTRRRSAADNLEPELPERCPRRLAFLLQRCWEKDPSGRPDFREICKELRYIKGLLLTGDQLLLQNVDTQLQKMKPIQKIQGPWGGDGGSAFFDGFATGIRKLTISFTAKNHVFWCLRVQYDKEGQENHCTHGQLGHAPQTEITFDYPLEYLQQIEGYYGVTPAVVCGGPVTSISSITFKSNIKTYGPYGRHAKDHERFKSDIGKVVGFFGRSGICLDQIGVLHSGS